MIGMDMRWIPRIMMKEGAVMGSKQRLGFNIAEYTDVQEEPVSGFLKNLSFSLGPSTSMILSRSSYG